MAKMRKLPELADSVGNLKEQLKGQINEFDFSGVGTDCQERIDHTDDPFCQGTEDGYDEFH